VGPARTRHGTCESSARSALATTALLVAVSALTGCGSVAPASSTGLSPSAPVSAADAHAVDRLFAPYDRADVPGAAVLVVKNGRPALVRTYGLAELETQARVTERTNFRIASLTKAFTATAVMLLVKDGRLTLDDRVSDIVRDFPAYGREISIRHLLGHTSGLRAYEDFVPETSTRQFKDRDVVTLLRRTDKLMFAPGTAFRYCDSNYALLAVVVEAVSGQTFARFLQERIFQPAGMTSSLAWEPGVSEVPHRAFGYGPKRRGGFGLADHTSTSTVLGDGGVYSSVRDLVAWDRALDEAIVLGPNLQPLMWTPGALRDGTRTHYGLGWFLAEDAGGAYAFHRGESSGFNNYIVKNPGRRLTVVVLTNRRGGSPADIAATIAAMPAFR
jgi:CubicO group peptidase (beta-lactamase class C family)